jgi:hypothetical protein
MVPAGVEVRCIDIAEPTAGYQTLNSQGQSPFALLKQLTGLAVEPRWNWSPFEAQMHSCIQVFLRSGARLAAVVDLMSEDVRHAHGMAHCHDA